MLGLRMSRNLRQTQPKIMRMLSAWGTGKPLVKQERADIQLDSLRQTKPDDPEPIQLTDHLPCAHGPSRAASSMLP